SLLFILLPITIAFEPPRSWCFPTTQLERQTCTQLNLASRSCRLGDRSKLRRIHEAIRRPQVRMIQRIEELAAELELRALGDGEIASQGKVQSLHSRSVYRVSAYVTEGECRRSGECCPVEPLGCGTSARPKDWLTGIVGAIRIFAQRRSGVGGIAKH